MQIELSKQFVIESNSTVLCKNRVEKPSMQKKLIKYILLAIKKKKLVIPLVWNYYLIPLNFI